MKKIKLLVKQLLSLFPSSLPVGVTEFNKFTDDIVELTGNLADYNSIKFTLAGMIMHMPPQTNTIAKHYFVKSLRKVAANQVAHYVLTDIKTKQEEAARAAKLQQEEATKNAEETKAESEAPAK